MKRNTAQKRKIIEVINKLANHPSAESVYEVVHCENPKISKATVYRVLREEAEEGRLKSVDLPKEVNRYDHRTDAHWHIKCRICGKVGDVEMAESTERAYEKPQGWNIEDVTMAFTGICKECAEKLKENENISM